MKLFFVISTFTLIAICRGAESESPDELKLLTKLTPINSEQRIYSGNTRNHEDLATSASDRSYPGGYPGSIGGYPGSIGGYPGGYSGLYPGGYSGYGTGLTGSVYPGSLYNSGSVIPGGGYGYYGNYPGNGGYGGYGGYGGGGYGGYGGYGNYGGYGGYGGYRGQGGYGGYGIRGYDDGNLGYGRGGYGRYDGYDGYGYGNAYGSTYAARSPYPYSYRTDSYGTSLSNPTGYRGYS
ncbi:PREDICTED: keratin-associated protein 19-2-like isoform X2 [Vollenhovia emeryi]|uniref:keratin-associated protein 19-2-like isoform X2 n=1 Tax=Vollenhovia emeryi TaxID=411798 RepID=UPI0005F4FB95|nr:PREDICTED: keratin-associated protein 19-2-like isoform X2 [Vollenhovia emeryi]